MPLDVGPITNKELTAIRRETKRLLQEPAAADCGSTADLMKLVLTRSEWEPFPVESHLVPDYPIPLPAAAAAASSAAAADRADHLLPSLVEHCDGVMECQSEDRGRFLVASRNLKPGEVLIREKGFVNVVGDKYVKEICETCLSFSKGNEFQRCSRCQFVVWCSSRCRESAQNGFHKYECATKRQLAALKADHFFLAMRMIIEGWQNLLRKLLTGLSLGEVNGEPDEFNLIENKDKLTFEKTMEAAVICKVFLWILKTTGFVELLKKRIASEQPHSQLLANDLNTTVDHFIASTLLSHWIRIQCNAFQHNFQQIIRQPFLPDHVDATIIPFKHVGFGIILTLKIAQINHSCRPNCDYFFVGRDQVVCAIEEISAGDEIFITYERMARTLTEREDRINHVARNYGFCCFCKHCNVPGFDLCELYEREKDAAVEIVEKVGALIEDATEMMSRSQTEDALAALFALKKICVENSMHLTASEVDDRIDECLGLMGTTIVTSF